MSVNSLTEGSILKPLMKFAVPVIIALILQSLYGAVDLMVVGQFATSGEVSAVATGSQIMHTLTQVVAGLSMGTTILIGQQLGEGKRREAGKTVGASIAFFAVFGIILSVAVGLNASGISTMMNAPVEAFDQTVSYVTICGFGLVFIKKQRKQRLFTDGLTIPALQCISQSFLLIRYLYCMQDIRLSIRPVYQNHSLSITGIIRDSTV